MNVTILCDASYCPTYRVAGYGFWIACNRGRWGGGGEITRERICDNNVAEMMAIANSIWHGLKRGLLEEGDILLVQSDSLRAMEVLGRMRPSDRPEEWEVLRYFENIVHKHKLKVDFRHVKAHTSVTDKRSLANRMCDKRAKDAMRRARERKIKQQVQEMADK